MRLGRHPSGDGRARLDGARAAALAWHRHLRGGLARLCALVDPLVDVRLAPADSVRGESNRFRESTGALESPESRGGKADALKDCGLTKDATWLLLAFHDNASIAP